MWWERLNAHLSVDELEMSRIEVILHRIFKLKERNTTVYREIKCGVLHFVSSAFILAVNPSLLEQAGFQSTRVAAATAISAGVSCILCGFVSNLPFVLAPTTSTSIYFSIFLQNRNMRAQDGNAAVFLLGIMYSLCGIRPIALFITNTIPFVIKVGVCLGVGLLIALEALIEIGLVKTGEHTVLDIGNFTISIYIAMMTFVVIGLALHYHIRGAFLIGLCFGTFFYWLTSLDKYTNFTASNHGIIVDSGDIVFELKSFQWSIISGGSVLRLVFDLYIIGVILLNGLAHGLAETAGLKREDNTLPRGKWLYAMCGVGTMLAACLGAGPIMISPESAPGIKAGGRSGLCAVTCGCLFLLATIFCPLFASAPAAGTSPVLLMIGMMLFENAKNVNWSTVKEALPVFLMAVFIPFTYSIFNGVIFGFGIYLILFVCTESQVACRRLAKWSRKFMSKCKQCATNVSSRICSNCWKASTTQSDDCNLYEQLNHSDTSNSMHELQAVDNYNFRQEREDVDMLDDEESSLQQPNLSFLLNEINDSPSIDLDEMSTILFNSERHPPYSPTLSEGELRQLEISSNESASRSNMESTASAVSGMVAALDEASGAPYEFVWKQPK